MNHSWCTVQPVNAVGSRRDHLPVLGHKKRSEHWTWSLLDQEYTLQRHFVVLLMTIATGKRKLRATAACSCILTALETIENLLTQVQGNMSWTLLEGNQIMISLCCQDSFCTPPEQLCYLCRRYCKGHRLFKQWGQQQPPPAAVPHQIPLSNQHSCPLQEMLITAGWIIFDF